MQRKINMVLTVRKNLKSYFFTFLNKRKHYTKKKTRIENQSEYIHITIFRDFNTIAQFDPCAIKISCSCYCLIIKHINRSRGENQQADYSPRHDNLIPLSKGFG